MQNFCQLSHKAFLFIKTFSLHLCKMLFKNHVVTPHSKVPKPSGYMVNYFSQVSQSNHIFFTNKEKEKMCYMYYFVLITKLIWRQAPPETWQTLHLKTKKLITKTCHNLLINNKALFDIQLLVTWWYLGSLKQDITPSVLLSKPL